MKKTFSLGILGLTLLFPSCASIVSGTKQEIRVYSTPHNATVWVGGANRGVTPLIMDLERKDDQKIKIELEGYVPFEVTLTRKLNGWFWGNILLGGLIGILVDSSTGAMYKLTPEQIDSHLEKAETIVSRGNEIYIGVVLEADPNLEKIGNLVSK